MIRLKAIASLIDKDAKVVDIGTDHAYLPIYLYQNNKTKNITASDISSNVLEYSKKNIKEANLLDEIKIVKSDGFQDLNEEYDIAVISGLGTNTIKKILDYPKIPSTLIISSHNQLLELRTYMQEKGYKILKEIVVFENKKYYDIIKYQKGKEKLTERELLLGKSNNIEFENFCLNKYKDIYNKSHNKTYLKYIEIIEKK